MPQHDSQLEEKPRCGPRDLLERAIVRNIHDFELSKEVVLSWWSFCQFLDLHQSDFGQTFA